MQLSQARRLTVQTVQRRLCTAPYHDIFVANHTAEASHGTEPRKRGAPIVCMMFSQFHEITCLARVLLDASILQTFSIFSTSSWRRLLQPSLQSHPLSCVTCMIISECLLCRVHNNNNSNNNNNTTRLCSMIFAFLFIRVYILDTMHLNFSTCLGFRVHTLSVLLHHIESLYVFEPGEP